MRYAYPILEGIQKEQEVQSISLPAPFRILCISGVL